MSIVYVPVKKIYGRTAGFTHTKSQVPPIPFNANDHGLTSWSMLGNGEQTGTPSPENIIMPTFCGVKTGNLFDIEKWLSDNNVPFTKSAGSYTFYTSYALFENPCYFSTADITAAISVTITEGTASVVRLDTLHANGSMREYSSITEETSTRVISGVAGIRLNWTNPGTTTLSFCMINAGITALPYEPFGYKIPLTNAGQTTPVYLGQTQTVRKVKKLVLDGTENWNMRDNENGTQRFYTGIQEPLGQGLSSHYAKGSANRIGEFDLIQNSKIVRFNGGQIQTVADWKSYLAQQYAAGTPVTVWYVLATPETAIVNEPLAKIGDYADELHSEDTTVTIPTANGANTISVDSTIPPSSLTIQYTSPDMSEIVRVVDGQGKPIYGPRYGFKIDKSQTDSASAIIYTHDAVTMTPAYMDYTNGSFNYGSWRDIWFVKDAKPVALNLDGTVAYYLDPDDYTKKIDGTNSDIFYTLLSSEPSDWSTQWKQYYHLNNGEYVLNDDAEAPTFAANTYYKLETSFTGNFMVQFPKVYFKRYEDENYNYVEVSDRKLSRDFKAYAHLNANGDELDFIYLPMFKGVIKDSKLRSIPGVIPQGGTTASTEVTAAEACGTGWQIWDHSSIEMIKDLLVLMSKNADSQAKFGKGRESGYDASDTTTYGKLQTGTLIKKGAFCGYRTSYSDVKVFHVEGPWANRWERLQGLLLVGGVYKIKMAPPYNFTGTDFVTLTTASPTSNNYARTLATSEYGSVIATVSAIASSPFKDYFYQNQSGTRVGLVGGNCYGGSYGGPRCVDLSNAASSSGWYFGASAIYKPST